MESFSPCLAAKKLARPLSPFSPTPSLLASKLTRCDNPSQTYERPSRMPATQAHLIAIDARKIGLAAQPRGHAAVERVIPDVQLPHGRRIDRGDKVAHA